MPTEWWEVRCQLTAFDGAVLNPTLYLTVAYEDAVTGEHRSSDGFASLAEALVFAARQRMHTRVVHCVIVDQR